jgi:hypothetical protein
MSNSRKKVIVRRFTGDVVPGYLPASSIVRGQAAVDLLDLSGRVVSLSLTDIKTISYVRDFNLNDSINPERLSRRTFLARPRSEGLWVRLAFRSGEVLEGLAPTDLRLLDAMQQDAGLYLIPPDTRANTQQLFVPRSAIVELSVLGVITAPSRRRPGTSEGDGARPLPLQSELF